MSIHQVKDNFMQNSMQKVKYIKMYIKHMLYKKEMVIFQEMALEI